MKTITIGFSNHKGFAPLSKLIMICEGTKFSHAYLKIHSDFIDRDMIYQATGSGVNFCGKEIFDSTANIVKEYVIQLPDNSRKKLLQWCFDNSGKPYGHLQILGLGIIRAFKLFGFNIKNPFSNGDTAYVCCELVVMVLKECGIQINETMDEIDLLKAQELAIQFSS